MLHQSKDARLSFDCMDTLIMNLLLMEEEATVTKDLLQLVMKNETSPMNRS